VKHILALIVASALCRGAEGTGASIARLIEKITLDPNECYRVRDVSFQKEDIKVYLNDGHLLFAQAIDGRRIAAVFMGDVPGGDAEVIVFPPHTSERLSLASFIKSPNLNEHFVASVFLFSDDTGSELLAMLKDTKKDPDAALMISGQFNSVVRNIATSYELRLLYDMLSSDWKENGLFFAAISGKNFGNFDVIYDPRGREQIMTGQLAFRENRRFFDTWTSFPSRSVRNGARKLLQDPFSLESFAIDARLTPDLNLHAKTSITLKAKSGTDRVITFDLSRKMKVLDVRMDGQPVEYFVRESLRSNLRNTENDTFLVILPKPLETGESRTLEIAHEGGVITAAGNGVYYVAARNNWYPNRDGAFSTYDLSFRFPKNLQLVSSGDVVEDRTDEEWRVTRRKVSTPIRFAGFNLGDYLKASQTRAGFTIDVYANRKIEAALQPKSREVLSQPVPLNRGRRLPESLSVPVTVLPPDPKARLRELADEIGAAMEFMSANFGPPPLKTLIVSPIPGTFGQGFPGLLYLSTLAYIDPSEYPSPLHTESQRRFFSELLHAHEVAHQWWGNLVVPGGYQDDWLMEALANYSALMFLEKRKGRKALEEVLDEYRQHLLAERSEGKTVESAGPIVLGARLYSSQTANSWRAILYEKGAWIVHMLRVRMGDAAFMKMLNAVAQRNRYGRVTTEAFRKLAAEFLPKGSDDPQLESFFEQWAYGTGIPSLKLTHTVRGKAPKVHVTGSVAQTGVSEDFSIAVPIEMLLPGKRLSTRWVRTSNESATFTADLAQAPLKINIDPYAILMRR
jgi:hypothetical protein